MFLKDNLNSYKLLSNGKYLKIKDKKKSFSVHDYYLILNITNLRFLTSFKKYLFYFLVI